MAEIGSHEHPIGATVYYLTPAGYLTEATVTAQTRDAYGYATYRLHEVATGRIRDAHPADVMSREEARAYALRSGKRGILRKAKLRKQLFGEE